MHSLFEPLDKTFYILHSCASAFPCSLKYTTIEAVALPWRHFLGLHLSLDTMAIRVSLSDMFAALRCCQSSLSTSLGRWRKRRRFGGREGRRAEQRDGEAESFFLSGGVLSPFLSSFFLPSPSPLQERVAALTVLSSHRPHSHRVVHCATVLTVFTGCGGPLLTIIAAIRIFPSVIDCRGAGVTCGTLCLLRARLI